MTWKYAKSNPRSFYVLISIPYRGLGMLALKKPPKSLFYS
jgi:hypothetical protein